MTGSITGIITACATVLIAVGGIITALAVLVPTLRKVDGVHTIVNQQRTDMQRYQRALLDALGEAGIDAPVDQSMPLPLPDDRSPPP
jgi:hypothetical protein